MRISLQEELDQLEASLQEEGALVLRALRGCLNALSRQDAELADEVIAFDDEVDETYIGIEEGIQSLLARQTPVAIDLRNVLAVLHINLHLERMADYCVTVAKLTKLVHDSTPDATLTEALEDMGTRAEEMIQTALDSFANRDVASAESLVDLDELIDGANRRVVHQILSSPPTPTCASGACGCCSCHAAWNGSAITPWTSASRRRSSSADSFREFTDASH
jgi:phosphate transport system protein